MTLRRKTGFSTPGTLDENASVFGASVMRWHQAFTAGYVPAVSREFTDAMTEQVNVGLAPHNQFDADSVFAAFQHFGYRPAALLRTMGELALNGEAAKLCQFAEFPEPANT